MKSGGAVRFKAGERCPRSIANPPAGLRTKAARPIGCKARQVRVTHAGVGSLPVVTPRSRRATGLRSSAKNADREKLNDERGIKPLPVSRSRDGAESGKACSGWIKCRFCIRALESSPNRLGLATMVRREPHTCLTGLDAHRPTHVIAVAESLNNRARSVAAGLVIRCRGCKPAIQKPTLMRVSPVGPAQAGRNFSKAVEGACAC